MNGVKRKKRGEGYEKKTGREGELSFRLSLLHLLLKCVADSLQTIYRLRTIKITQKRLSLYKFSKSVC